jgi:uncharacterized protein YxeA/putative methionine-R-sulfoxide reductase with GAF domain
MKSFLKKYSIPLAIFLSIILMLIAAAFSFYNRQIMLDNTALKEEVEKIKQKMQSLHNQGIKSSDLTVRAFALSKSEKMLQFDIVQKITAANFDTLETLLKKRNYDLKPYYAVKDTILNYLKFQEYMLDLVRKDSMVKFKQLFILDKGNNVWAFYNQYATQLFAKENALFNTAQSNYEAAMNNNIWLQLLLIFVGVPTLLFVMYQLRQEAINREKVYQALEQNNRAYLFDSGVPIKGDVGRAVIRQTIQNLQKAGQFVQKIAEGNYEVTWDGLNQDNQAFNQHNLVGALMKMKYTLQQAKREDAIRLWINESLTKFSSLLRSNQQNINQLAKESLSFLAQTTQAQSGNLYLLNEGFEKEPTLKLYAGYASNRAKLAQKEFLAGEGLIGQVFLNAKIQLIDNLPDDYIISSGLGNTVPKNLIILPIIYNEKVQGVLELASLFAFENHQIDFLEKTTEYLGATLALNQISSKN